MLFYVSILAEGPQRHKGEIALKVAADFVDVDEGPHIEGDFSDDEARRVAKLRFCKLHPNCRVLGVIVTEASKVE